MALTLSPEDFDEIRKIVRTELMTVPAPQGRPAQAARGGGAPDGAVFPPFGKTAGMPIKGAQVRDLEFYAGAARRSIADPSKAQYLANNERVLMAIEAELIAQGHPVSQPYRAAAPARDNAAQSNSNPAPPAEDPDSIPF